MFGRIFHRVPNAAALTLLLAATLALPAQVAVSASEYNPVRRHPAAAASASIQRVIVKLRAADANRVQAQSAASTTEAAAPSQQQTRVQALAQRVGLALKQSREISSNLHVLSLGSAVYGETPAETLERLRSDPSVEFAEIDRRRYSHAVPNDPFFQPGNSTSGQWHLRNDAATPAAINATTAWDTTTGVASVVVAILDTGVLFDHPDLGRADQGGRLLPGYDFVSADPGAPNSFLIANDGDGWDANASDPGDWISSADTNNPRFSNCDVSGSSWHGTRVAGIVGAQTNNLQGIAGITWAPVLLPVRVLGKCGGFDSDIIAAMRWAAGIHVAGVPDNPNPAKIINLSLGSTDPCSQSYRNVITELTALGVLVVASAGNEIGQAVDSPANCPGVLAVAGLRHVGTKVGYSNMGPEIGIAAPAGNCGDINSGPCLYSIDTTVNSGSTVANPNGYTYTDSFNTNLGTSFSAPIVAAAAALVLSVDPSLTPAQLTDRLKQTATPFPDASATIPVCPASDPVSGQCSCTTSTCGAGMLNVAAAVSATSPAPQPPPPTTPSSGGGGGGGGGTFGLELFVMGLLAIAQRLRRGRPLLIPRRG